MPIFTIFEQILQINKCYKNYIGGIKTVHYLFGFSVDHINDFLVNLSIRGIAWLQPHCPKQAKAITPEILLKFSTLLNLSDP